MVLISYSGREINAKLVYYGPGLSGKTTNLEFIYGAIPQTHRGKMVSMKTKTERTLFFDFLPIDLGELSGFKTRFLLYTVPGQVYYNATRKLVLKGVDAIVFVADSKRGKMDENIESLQNLRENLREHGIDLDKLPWVIQYNKRDLPDVYSIEELERALNPGKVPAFEAIGTTGVGVFETFKAMSRMLLKHLAHEIGVRVVAAPVTTREPVAEPTPATPATMPAAPPQPVPIAPQVRVPAPREPDAVAPPMGVPAPPQPVPVAPPVSVPAPPQSVPVAPPLTVATAATPAPRTAEPEPVPETVAPLEIEPLAPPPRRTREAVPVPPAEPVSVPIGASSSLVDEERPVVTSEHSFDQPPASVPSIQPGDPVLDEADRRQRMGGRLRRWFGRSREAEGSAYTVEMDVDRETVTRPTAPEPSSRPEIMTAYPTVTVPASAEAAKAEPRFREVPILVDLEPEDIERGVVLKLRICVRRANEYAGEEPERRRQAA